MVQNSIVSNEDNNSILRNFTNYVDVGITFLLLAVIYVISIIFPIIYELFEHNSENIFSSVITSFTALFIHDLNDGGRHIFNNLVIFLIFGLLINFNLKSRHSWKIFLILGYITYLMTILIVLFIDSFLSPLYIIWLESIDSTSISHYLFVGGVSHGGSSGGITAMIGFLVSILLTDYSISLYQYSRKTTLDITQNSTKFANNRTRFIFDTIILVGSLYFFIYIFLTDLGFFINFLVVPFSSITGSSSHFIFPPGTPFITHLIGLFLGLFSGLVYSIMVKPSNKI